MSDDKNLKIGMKFDDKGGKSAAASLEELKKKANDFNKTIGALNNSLKALNVELKLKVKDFGSLTKEMEKTGKGFQSQIKDITAYTKALEKLNSVLRLNTKNQPGQNKPHQATQVVGGVAQPVSSTLNAGIMGGNTANNPLFVQVVGGNGGNGGGGQLLPLPGGGFQNANPNKRNAWINGGRNVAAGNWPGGIPHGEFNLPRAQDIKLIASMGQNMANFVQEMKLAPAQNQATVKDFRGQMFRSMIGGDFSDQLALTIMNREGKSAHGKFGGTGAISAGGFLGGVANVASGVTSGLAGVASGGVSGATNAWRNSVAGGKEAQEASAMGQGLEAVKRMNPIEMALFSNLMANSAGGLAASRRLGSGMTAAGMGVRAGMGPAESWQFMTQGANQFGGQVMMGGDTGASRSVPTGRTIQDPKQIALWESYKANMAPDAWAKMYGQAVSSGNMNTPEMRTESIRNRGLGSSVLDFQQKGFDRNTMTSLMGNVQAMAPGDDAARMGQTEKIFTRAVSEGVSKGIKDIQTLEALATAIAEGTYSRTAGFMGDTGQLGAMLTGGLGGNNANPLAVSQRNEGLTAFGQAQQSNPFLMNRNMARANETLGAGGSVGKLMALSQATPQELLSGGGLLGTYGIGAKERMAQLTGTLDDTLTMAVKAEPELGILLAEAGGDYSKALKNPRFRALAAGALKGSLGGMGDLQNNNRFLETFAYLDRTKLNTEEGAQASINGLKDRGGGFLGPEAAKAQVQTKALSEAFNEEHMPLFKDALKAVGSSFDTLSGLKGLNLADATGTIQALEKLIEKIANLDPKKVDGIREKLDRVK